MPTFNIADRVFLSDYGIGSVDWLGDQRIGVVFDSVGKVLLRRDLEDLRLATAEDEQATPCHGRSVADAGVAEAPEPSLVFEEGDDERHSMGSHWAPFFDDARPVVEHLPKLLRVATLSRGYEMNFPPAHQTEFTGESGIVLAATTESIAGFMNFSRQPHQWDHLIPWRSPDGVLTETPERAQASSERNTGVALVITLSTTPGEPNVFRSMFPYCMDGTEHEVELKRVFVWRGDVEAQLEARIGGSVITFYDADFVTHRGWYRRDGKYRFVFVAVAYDAGPAEVRTFTIPRTVEHFEGMQWLTGEDRQPESGALEETYSTEGMVCLLPVDGWDVDDYEFQGQIEEIWGMSILGQRAWRIRTVVMRHSASEAGDVNVPLDIVVTERAWKGDDPPRVGQAIAGHLWLQGRLLSSSPVTAR